MKVEFIVNTTVGCDGRQILIHESEFKKAKSNEDEFNSFAFATHCFFRFYGLDRIIYEDEYNHILKQLNKGEAVIISVEQDRLYYYPIVIITDNYQHRYVDLNSIG